MENLSITLESVGFNDLPVLRNLLNLYIYDFSEFTDIRINPTVHLNSDTWSITGTWLADEERQVQTFVS